MADTNFNINLKVNVDKGKSTQQVNAIKKSLEKKKIKLKIDTSAMKKQLTDFKKSLTGVNKSLNNAFKLDSKNLKNLQDLKKVLSEINKLSKKTQVKVTSSKETSQVNSDLEKQKNKYLQLLKMKQSLEKQMASTSNATSYRNLKEQLELVTREAENCKTKISELSKLKLKTDMTKSMSSQFQTVQKQAQSLKTSLEKTLKNTNLTSTQKKDLNELLTIINKVSQTRFRLKTSDAEAQIQKLIQEITNVSSKYSKIKINIDATSNINKTEKSVDSMMNKLKQAQNTKIGANSFINSKDLNKLISDAEKLKQNLKNIDMKGNVATETAKILKQLDAINNKFKNLQNIAKLDMKLGGGVTTANKQIDNLISKINTVKTQKIGGDAFIDETKLTNLITRLQSLKTNLTGLDVNSEKVVAEFEQIKNSINKTETELKELQSAGKFELKLEQSKNTLDSLGNQIDKLEQKIKKLGGDESTVRSLRQELANISKLPLGQQAVAIGELRNKITHAKNETDKLSSSAKNATKNMTTLGSSTKRFGTFFSNLYSSMSTYSLGNIISMQMTKAIYGITDTIRELDKAFVAFNKVAPESFHGTAEEFDNLREKAIDVGQDVARSSVDIINSTASALQLGIDDIDKALEYARNVNMYANVADVSEEQSDKYIKSIMSAYGGVDESLDEMTNKVKGAGAGYSLLNDYMDEAESLPSYRVIGF